MNYLKLCVSEWSGKISITMQVIGHTMQNIKVFDYKGFFIWSCWVVSTSE